MISILFTLGLLFFTLVLFTFTGLTILKLTKINDKYSTLIAPTLGLAFITIAAQNLVYLNIPLKYGAWMVLGIVVILFVYILYRKNLVIKIPKLPQVIKQKFFFLSCIIVIAASGSGIFLTSSQEYIGQGTRDQWNYTVTSQFLIDFPFSYIDIDHNPYVALAIVVKNDRIGVSVIQGVIATLTNNNAKTVYGVVSLLGPIFLAVNLWLLGRKLKCRPINCFFLATIGSTLPGISYLLVENNNFAHIVSLPFMYILPILFHDLITQPKFNKAIIVGIILSAANSIYSDISPLYLVLAGGMIILNLVYNWSIEAVKNIFMVVGVFVLALIFNLGFMHTTIQIFSSRITIPMFYPEFALKLEGLYKIWNQLDLNFPHSIINQLLLFATFFGFSGLVLIFVNAKEKILPFGLLTLVVLPIILLGSNKPYPYQFYKILISIFPFLILGLVSIKEELQRRKKNFLIDTVLSLILLFLLFITFFSTIKIDKKANFYNRFYTSGNIKNTLTTLETAKDKNLLIITDNKQLGSWLSYHARYNRIYLLKDFYGVGWNMKGTYDLPYLNLKDIDNNDIKVINLSIFNILPQSADQLVGATIDNEEFGNSRDYNTEPAFLNKKINISLWARKDLPISLSFKIATDKVSETPPIELLIGKNTEKYSEYIPTENKIIYNIQAITGVQYITIKNLANNPLTLSDFNISSM